MTMPALINLSALINVLARCPVRSRPGQVTDTVADRTADTSPDTLIESFRKTLSVKPFETLAHRRQAGSRLSELPLNPRSRMP